MWLDPSSAVFSSWPCPTGEWLGVVWCGVVWRGVAWCGVVWRDVAWFLKFFYCSFLAFSVFVCFVSVFITVLVKVERF